MTDKSISTHHCEINTYLYSSLRSESKNNYNNNLCNEKQTFCKIEKYVQRASGVPMTPIKGGINK